MEISEARQRQNRFLMNQYESKSKHLKVENDRLEKQLINVKIKEQYGRVKIKELEQKVKENDIVG